MTITTDQEAPLIDDTPTDLFALLCHRRGWSDEYLASIENGEHKMLRDLDRLVETLHTIHDDQVPLTISPDFDMDGISSGVLGYAGLSELGFDVELYVPDYRLGHELTTTAVHDIAAKHPRTRALITCDGGVNSHEGIVAARDLGWTTLVTDHHEELAPGSSADITVDPCRMDDPYDLKGICGAHVLYQVLETYARTHDPDKLWSIQRLRLFAGLGTISDVMPLLYENRQLVRDSLSIARLLWVAPPRPDGTYGEADPDAIDIETSIMLQMLAADPHHPVYTAVMRGFGAVLKAFTQAGKIRDIDSLDEGFYGFYLAPAMNAPRRIDSSLEDCFACFTADTTELQLKAAHRVIEGNERRKQMTIEYLDEFETDQPFAPWVYFSSAPTGMYGLLANQMMHRHDHPVVVMSRPLQEDQPVGGSGRAPEWFDIISSLEPHEGLSAVGHQQACGVRVDHAHRIPELIDVLEAATTVAMAQIDSDAPAGDVVLGPDPDCDADLEDLSPLFEFVRRTEALKPYGQGFVQPTVEIAVEAMGLRVQQIGTEGQHLRLISRTGLVCLWWNAVDEHFEEIVEATQHAGRTARNTLRFAARLQLNTFRGETKVQAIIDRQVDRDA